MDCAPANPEALLASINQQHTLVEQVRKDLERGLKNTRTRPHGITLAQVLITHVSIPQRGGHKTTYQDALERSKAFKRAQRFRPALRAASRCCSAAAG